MSSVCVSVHAYYVTYLRWRQLFARQCMTCLPYLPPSAPVTPPAICSYWSGLSLVCHVRRTSAHRSPGSLHCWVAKRIQFKLATVSFHGASIGTAPRCTVYFRSSCRWRSFPSTPTFFFRQRSALFVQQRNVIVGDGAFPVSAAKGLNKLPGDVHCIWLSDEMFVASRIMWIMLWYTWTKARNNASAITSLYILLNGLQCKHKKLTRCSSN